MNTEAEILEFLKVKENTGALLLSGKWGCGKSYLIKKLATKLTTDAFAKAIINSTIVPLPEIIEEIKQKKEEVEQK